MKEKQYITQLTRQDMKEIAAAANLTPGLGLEVERREGALVIGISELALKRMIWTFYKNGGFAASASDIDGIPLDAVN